MRNIERIIQEFRGLKNIPIPGEAKSKSHIAVIKDTQGVEQRTSEGIAEVFVQFYEALYTGRAAVPVSEPRSVKPAPDITTVELEHALASMKNGRCRDESGLVAEMLKSGGDVMHTCIKELFNDVLQCDKPSPASWSTNRLIVLFKKGEPELPKNYRPIAILPILYKLFARILCNRVQPAIIGAQSPDQAADRKGYSAEDHLLTLTLLFEKCMEWNQEIWFGLVDFEKAFDTVEHGALWNVLRGFGVDECYIHLLMKLYRDQTGVVSAGTDSRRFSISRGVKQGDPVSALLFIAVMEECFRSLKQRWNGLNLRRTRHYYGIVIDDAADPLTNLRFADDVLLVAQSRQDAAKMLTDLKHEAAKYGLVVHLGKTKILATRDEHCGGTVDIAGSCVDVLPPTASERYLGKKLCMDSFHDAELGNRLRSGWCAFAKLRHVLCSRQYPLKTRFKLFDTAVTPAALYACGTWTMAAEQSRKLRTVWRQMVRKMVQTPRGADEPWVEYIQRATHIAEQLFHEQGRLDWATTQCDRKQRLAATLHTDGVEKWSVRLFRWRPWFLTTHWRRVGRPNLRWEDDVMP